MIKHCNSCIFRDRRKDGCQLRRSASIECDGGKGCEIRRCNDLTAHQAFEILRKLAYLYDGEYADRLVGATFIEPQLIAWAIQRADRHTKHQRDELRTLRLRDIQRGLKDDEEPYV